MEAILFSGVALNTVPATDGVSANGLSIASGIDESGVCASMDESVAGGDDVWMAEPRRSDTPAMPGGATVGSGMVAMGGNTMP
jgi:hypothetical protein